MDGINIDQLVAELGAYYMTHTKEIRQMFYNVKTPLKPYLTPVTAIKGKFPAQHTIITDVIQAFRAQWDEMGVTHFKVSILQNYHLKVNYPIVPATILNTYAAHLYKENTPMQSMPISRYIMMELKKIVAKNMAKLQIKGEYQADTYQNLLASMNGLLKILSNGVADSDNPMYKVPLAIITDDNAVDEISKFERNIPEEVLDEIDGIFCSKAIFESYLTAYENEFGQNTDYRKGDKLTTRLHKIPLIPLSYMGDSQFIFCTPKSNFLELIDLNAMPAITDIQKLDYKVKIFMESWNGIAFWINQLVIVSVNIGSGSGLTTDNDLYYNVD